MSRITQTIQSGAFTLSALALMLIPALALAPPVLADDDTPESSQTTESETETTEIETENLREKVRERTQEVRAEAKQSVERLRQKAEDKTERTQERRLTICENRKTSISNKLGAFKKTGDAKLARLDTAFEKLTTYQTDSAIAVDGFDELVATAIDAKTTATADVTVLGTLIDEGIDCTSEDIASQISGVKDAGLKARESLRAYRATLHDMLVALLQASGDTADTTPETTEGEN